MRLLIQWASDAPADWEAIESGAFRDLPKRSRGGNLGTAPGLLYKLQAREDIWSGYDSIAVEHTTYSAGSDPLYDAAGVLDGETLTRIRGRQDDVRDWPIGSRWERVADYFPMRARAELGGAIAPITRHTICAEPDIYPALAAAYAGNARTTVVEVSELGPAAADEDTRDGTWVGARGVVDTPEAVAHGAATSVRSWREWADHLPADETEGGRLKSQRARGRYVPLKHTRTYYHSDTALASNVHSGGATPDFEHALLTTTGTPATAATTVSASGTEIAVATSPVNEPGSASWSGTGFTVRHQLDIPSAGVDLTYGLLTQGGAAGHFARVAAGVPPSTELESHEQQEAAFSGGGLHLATFVGDWAAGAATDRFELLIAGVRVVGHGSQSFAFQLNELDDFADGDWPGAAQSAQGVAASASWNAPAATASAGLAAQGVAAVAVWNAPAASATVAPLSPVIRSAVLAADLQADTVTMQGETITSTVTILES
jgi:hypothetical protein